MTSESTHSYQQAHTADYDPLAIDDADDAMIAVVDRRAARRTLANFIGMSVCFSANHGCVVACLSLATSQMGSVGAWQSGCLYLSYTASAVLGATFVVKQLGAKYALVAGMALYCVYVGCFWVATQAPVLETPAALLGALIGGVGAGFLWTAQGSYFGRAAQDHAAQWAQPVSTSNATLASLFAFTYLAEEVALRALSTLLLQWGWPWSVVFASYTAVTVLSTILMVFVYDYPTTTDTQEVETEALTTTTTSDNSQSTSKAFYKVTAAWQLLRNDPKMKHMIGLNAVFGLTSAFLNSYVNGQVVKAVTHSNDSIGLFNAWVSCVAAGMSLVFGNLSNRIGKGPVLIVGALCFLGVVVPFVVLPDTQHGSWGVPLLLWVYTLHGTGRATFEGTLKALFADYFPYEKEGAFANIILQNGLSGAIGYVLTFELSCSHESRYCVRYSNGSLHNVFAFELLVIGTALLAIWGYWRASSLHRREEEANAEAPMDGRTSGEYDRPEDGEEADSSMIPLSTSHSD